METREKCRIGIILDPTMQTTGTTPTTRTAVKSGPISETST
jgi:hypothetical protein